MKTDDRIYVSGPSITKKEEEYVLEAVRTGWYDNANMFNQRFEEAFAKHTKRKYAVSLPSCTSAIHLTLEALNIKEGDEVIVPSLTWIATAAPIRYVGAKPIFVDVEEKSWCISVKSIEESITDKTKAIITVDLYGNMPEYDKLLAVAEKYKIPVIEDAAEAVGSKYKGRPAGNLGIAGVFSFHGSKMLTTGEGGMLVTDDNYIYKRALKMRDHGRATNTDKLFWNDEIGYKYKMSSMQAALGLAQLERVEELVSKKKCEFTWYQEELQDLEGIQLNQVSSDVSSNYWMVTIIIDPKKYDLTKEEIMKYLKQYNIDTRPIFYALNQLPAFEENKDGQKKCIVAEKLAEYGVNLPSDINITQEEVKKVCKYLRKLLQDKRKY